MMQFALKHVLEIRTCSEENTVLPVHETYFLVSLWEPNELQNICKVQSVNYAFMYVEEMSHDGGSHWTWSIVGFYPLLSLKASLNSQVRQWHCQSRRWISLATQRSCLSAQKVSQPWRALTFHLQSLAQGCFEQVCFQICASRSSQTKNRTQSTGISWDLQK